MSDHPVPERTADDLSVIGLMSGTSMDGIDIAHIVTDGRDRVQTGPFMTLPYDPRLREELARAVATRLSIPTARLESLESALTDAHGWAVSAFLDRFDLDRSSIDLIGFHGHTIFHDPANGLTRQIGNGARLAAWTGIDVVSDFRSADVAAGGQGAPLVPIFHQALAASVEKPVAVLNIGGVANITYIDDGVLTAFDTGPGNALLDDWVERHTGAAFDRDGHMAASGRVDDRLVASWLSHPYFQRTPPKSLDRNDFDHVAGMALTPADGAATLAAFTVSAAAAALRHLPGKPLRWLVTGGGRHNPVIMDGLAASTGSLVQPVEAVGWQGDTLEAQAFAYLAVRVMRCLPLTFPSTTGVARPMPGGRHHRPPTRSRPAG